MEFQVFLAISGPLITGIASAVITIQVLSVKIDWLRRDLEKLEARVKELEADK